MDAQTIVQALGGPTRVAKFLTDDSSRGHISVAAVAQWKLVPPHHVLRLCTLEKKEGGFFTPHEMRRDIFGPAPAKAKAA